MPRRCFLLVSLAVAPGCLSQVVPKQSGAAVTDEADVDAVLRSGAFRGGGFVRVSGAPFASTLEPDRLVNFFVSNDAAAAYEAITPDSTTAGAPFPVGGIVVREATDDHYVITALTVMVKREPGFFPDGGDFFFGVTDVNGQPVKDQGVVEWGALDECASCHAPRASTGFLFGVAKEHRAGTL